MLGRIKHIVNALGNNFPWTPIEIEEENWFSMTNCIEQKLSKNVRYIVNTTGGTKFMSLAVQSVFQKFDAKFYYIPNPENKLLAPFTNEIIPIKYRVNIQEYLTLHNIPYKEKDITKEKDYTEKFFGLFTGNQLKQRDFEIIELLRVYYRDKKSISISEVENCQINPKFPKRVPINDLNSFLTSIGFPLDNTNTLVKKELEYLTGGWFEEYIYHQIVEYIKPQDIAIGVEIIKAETTNQNDLDVVFTNGNKLFVIECKTGINKEALFNQTVYKASALKETMFGLPGNTFIFSLSKENEVFIQIAKNMKIEYYGNEYFSDKLKFMELINHILQISKN